MKHDQPAERHRIFQTGRLGHLARKIPRPQRRHLARPPKRSIATNPRPMDPWDDRLADLGPVDLHPALRAPRALDLPKIVSTGGAVQVRGISSFVQLGHGSPFNIITGSTSHAVTSVPELHRVAVSMRDSLRSS